MSSFGAPPPLSRIRRNKPEGENTNALKNILRDLQTQGQQISIEDFMLLISPHSGDKGAALTRVMTEDLNNFRKMVIKVYDTMTQDVSDVLANEQLDLGKTYAEKQRFLIQKMARILEKIKDINPDFDFKKYYANPTQYLATMFKMADMPDEEEIEAARRQLAYHRLQWLRSEGERLQAENTKLQERLNDLKKIQRKEISEAVAKEREAEHMKTQLEREQEAKQYTLEALTEELHETIIAEEKLTSLTKKREQNSTINNASKLSRSATKTSRLSMRHGPSWNVLAAAQIEKDKLNKSAQSRTSMHYVRTQANRSRTQANRSRTPQTSAVDQESFVSRRSSPTQTGAKPKGKVAFHGRSTPSTSRQNGPSTSKSKQQDAGCGTGGKSKSCPKTCGPPKPKPRRT